ncbi:MAG: hypothetical protein ACTSVW_06565 [Candidatus Njordarchaeales archaeon]
MTLSYKAPGFISLAIGIITACFGVVSYVKFPDVISEVASSLFIGVGVTLITTGLNELSKFYSSTSMLEKPILDLEVFNNNVHRVSALLYNSGRMIIEDAKAVMRLENINSKTLSRILVKDCNECNRCNAKAYLVNKVNPVIRGDLLPWAIPEKPIERPATMTGSGLLLRTDYVHITSISPHQSTRLLLFEFIPLNNDKYLIRFFSEYGAPGPADPSPRYYRACLYLDKNTVLKIKVTVSGMGLRKPLQFHLKINVAILDRLMLHIKEEDLDRTIKELQYMLI